MKKTNKLLILLFSVIILLILGVNYKVSASNVNVTNIPTVSNFANFETKMENGTMEPSFSSSVSKDERNWSRQFDFTINEPGYVLIRSIAKADNLNDYVSFKISVNSKNLLKEYEHESTAHTAIANVDFRLYLEKGTYTILLTNGNGYNQTLSTYLGFLPANTNILSAQYVSDSQNGKTIKLKINSLDKVSELHINNLNFSGAFTPGDKYTLDTNNCVTIDLENSKNTPYSYPYITISVEDIFGFKAKKEYKIFNNSTATITGITNKTFTGLPIKQTNYQIEKHYVDQFNYIVSYKNNTNVGTATMIFTGTKDTLGSVTKTFKINPAHQIKASSCKISLAGTSYTYDGKVKTPAVKVRNGKNQTIPASNYTIYYQQGRKNVGKYKVIVKFKGNTYTGSRTLYFTIKPKTTKISSAKRGKGNKVTIKWKKQSSQVNGYQIQYSTNKNFKNAKTVTINKNSTTSKTLSNLSRNKKYYLRIRTFKTIGKTKYYSSWK